MLHDFLEELDEGAIQLRDRYQFELKKDFSPKGLKRGFKSAASYTLEFYFFIPASLQINQETYSKTQFYHDQTTYIRYKTPQMPLVDLVDWNNLNSPLGVLWNEMQKRGSVDPAKAIYEWKLFANMVRTRLRDRVRTFIHDLPKESKKIDLNHRVVQFLHNIQVLRTNFDLFGESFFQKRVHKPLIKDWRKIDEYISLTIDHYMTGFLLSLREQSGFHEAEELIESLLIQEDRLRKVRYQYPSLEVLKSNPDRYHELMMRNNLLSKYVHEVLFLQVVRKEPSQRFRQIGAVFAAGFAMLVYLILLAFNWPFTFADSAYFIVLTVIFYVLKDRLKEGIRNFSAHLAAKLYPDFNLRILDPETGERIGGLSEYMVFVEDEEVPQDILHVRQDSINQPLDDCAQPESVMYVKKDVELTAAGTKPTRLRALTDLFRFNISEFLLKASDALEKKLLFDPETCSLVETSAPRWYTIDVVIKSCFLNKSNQKRVEFDTYRILFDKEGIQRVEK